MSQYLKQHDIIHRVSCPHTPEQNGTAERKHRHIIETCLSLLTEAHMPSKFWDEAVSTAVYLINRLPTPVLKNRSSFEVLFKEQPNYEILKTFGCLCYPNLRPYSLNKLTVRFQHCVFLGYNAMHLGYRCFSIDSGMMFISLHVIFNEEVFPFQQKTLSPTTQSTSQRGMDTTLGNLGAYPSPLISTTTNPTQKPVNILEQQSSQVQNDVNTIQDQSQQTDSTSNSSDSQVENSTHLESSPTPKERSLCEIYAETEKLSPTPKNPQAPVKVNEVIPEVTTRPKRNRKIKTFTATTSRHPLPTCLSAISSTLEPSNYIIASRDPNWVDVVQFDYLHCH